MGFQNGHFTTGSNSAQGSFIEYDAGSSGTAKTLNFALGDSQKLTMTGNCTLSFSGMQAGGAYNIRLVQDGTGGRSIIFPASVKWPSAVAPTLSYNAGSIDMVTLYFDGTNYYGTYAYDFR